LNYVQAKNATNVEQAFMTMAAEIKNRVGPAAANQAGSAGTLSIITVVSSLQGAFFIIVFRTVLIY
jgi:hypothetical protein